MSKYPQGQLDNIDPTEVQEMVGSLKELYDLGKPKTDEEVKERIEQYFQLCQRTSLRPGIEGMSLALHVSRKTLYSWSVGCKCSKERQEIIEEAKSFINAFIEASVLSGKISPPSGIFLLKNWCGYKDQISIEDNTDYTDKRQVLSVKDLPILTDFGKNGLVDINSLPKLGGEEDV